MRRRYEGNSVVYNLLIVASVVCLWRADFLLRQFRMDDIRRGPLALLYLQALTSTFHSMFAASVLEGLMNPHRSLLLMIR